jgi:hypothetical protein
MDYGGPGKPYGEDEEDDTTGWKEIEVKDLLRSRRGEEVPFRLFANRFKSSSPDWESFLHDPLRHMLITPGALKDLKDWPAHPGDKPDPRNDKRRMRALRDDPRWHVTTFVTNHHRKLSRIHASVLAIVGDDGIHMMIYKDAGQG